MNALASSPSIDSLMEEIKHQVSLRIEELGRTPRMALLRCVSDPGAVFMEKQIRAACRDTGVECWFMELPSYLAEDVLVKAVHQIGQDVSVDAVALLCPSQYDKVLLGSAIGEQKDINGFSRTSSSRFLPCFDSSISQILDHFQIDCTDKKILLLHYDKARHYILRRILGIRGGDVFTRDDSSEEPGVVPDVIITAGKLSDVPASALASAAVTLSIAVGDYGEPLFPEDSQIPEKDNGKIYSVPGGVELIIPYIYALNAATAAN